MKLPPYSPKLAHGDPVARHLLRSLGPPRGAGLCVEVVLSTRREIKAPHQPVDVALGRDTSLAVYGGRLVRRGGFDGHA